MYAVVDIGGRQYRVSPGDEILVEKLEKSKGDSFELPVLLMSDDAGVRVGKPHVDGASLTAEVMGDEKGEKLTIFKYHPKKRYRVKKGHRQTYSRVKILNPGEMSAKPSADQQ